MRKASPALVGAFVVGAIVIIVVLVAAIGSGQLFRKRYPFVLHFPDSINGLREGAPVKFKGVHVGSVRSIKLPLRRGDPDMPIPVLIEIEGRQIAQSQDLEELPEELDLADEIQDGLRAQLVVESIVTGILFVSLDYRPETPMVLHGTHGDIPEIPTLPSDFDSMRSEASQIFAELMRIDFAGLVERSKGAMAALEETSHAVREAAIVAGGSFEELTEELRATAQRTRDALESVQRVAVAVEGHVEPLAASLRSSSERLGALQGELETTLRSARTLLDPQSPIAVRLESALVEVERAARSTRGLVEYVERNPSALVRGAGAKEDR